MQKALGEVADVRCVVEPRTEPTLRADFSALHGQRVVALRRLPCGLASKQPAQPGILFVARVRERDAPRAAAAGQPSPHSHLPSAAHTGGLTYIIGNARINIFIGVSVMHGF